MADTMTTGHGHDERNEDHRAATSYVVPNSWEHARRRLEQLETCYDAASFRRAAALGVREGWRCLEAGAGHGSYARWLGSQVGAAGSVIAADLDTRLLAGITEPNIEVRQLDLVCDPPPGGQFDFIHTRMVLTHLPAREQVLRRLCAALRPGGIVMVEDLDAFTVLATATGAYREAWLAVIQACRAAGLDMGWAGPSVAAASARPGRHRGRSRRAAVPRRVSPRPVLEPDQAADPRPRDRRRAGPRHRPGHC